MSENSKKDNEEKYIKNLVKLGKMISIEAAKNPKLEEKIKKHLPSGKVKYDWVLRAGQKRNEALDIFAYSTTAAFFYIDNIAHKDKKGYINYKALWNYLSSSGAWFEHLDKFAEKEESKNN